MYVWADRKNNGIAFWLKHKRNIEFPALNILEPVFASGIQRGFLRASAWILMSCTWPVIVTEALEHRANKKALGVVIKLWVVK